MTERNIISPSWVEDTLDAAHGVLPKGDDSLISGSFAEWNNFKTFLDKGVKAGKTFSTDIISTYSLVYTTINAYSGGVLAANGDLHFVPLAATVGQKISSGVVSTYSLLTSISYTPSFVVGTNYNQSLGTSFAYPSGIQAGDFIIIAQSNDTGDVSTVPTDSSSTTYTSLVQYTGSNPDYLISYKFADGTESGTNVTITRAANNLGAAVIQVFRNIDTTTPFDATYTTSSGATGDPDAPSITTVTNNAIVVAIGFLDDDDAVTVTVPTGYSNLNYGESNAGSGADSVTMMASKLVATAGAENPPVFSTTGDDEWQAVTMALRPKASVNLTSYFGGVLAPNGDIHFVPFSATIGQKVSANGLVSTYSLVYTTGSAYSGAVISPSGDIHFVPRTAVVGQKISTAGVVSTYSLVYTINGAYIGGVLAPNGDIHFIPSNAALGQKISAAGVVSTYSLVYTTTTAYFGGVLASNGDIHFIPNNAAVGQKISAAGVVSTYSLAYTVGNAYSGGVLAPNGDIHFVPQNNLGQKISATGVVSTYSLGYTTTTAYRGGILASNGEIHFIPRDAIVGQKINVGSARLFNQGVAASPWLNKF